MKRFEWIGAGFGTLFTIVQTNEIYQKISLILTIISTLVATAYTLYCWWKKAKLDGKISQEEAKEGIEIVTKAISGIKDVIDKEDTKDGNNN